MRAVLTRGGEVLLLLLALTMPAVAEPTDWTQRLAKVRQCHAARQTFLTSVARVNGLLWFASTDNHPRGYINPGVVNEARQQIQEIVSEFDWRFRDLAGDRSVDPSRCRSLALNTGEYVMALVRHVLATGMLPGPLNRYDRR